MWSCRPLILPEQNYWRHFEKKTTLSGFEKFGKITLPKRPKYFWISLENDLSWLVIKRKVHAQIEETL